MNSSNVKTENVNIFRECEEFFSSFLTTKIIFALAVVLRFVAFLFANPAINQHDVIQGHGHFDYAMYLFMYGKLPPVVSYEFRQPPVNAALQALVMRFLSIFRDYSDNYLYLYYHTKILTLIYSILTLVIIYKILSEFDIPQIIKNFIFAVMSFYPGLIIMTTQYSNDPISYMFFYLSLYLTIKWCKNKKLSTIILLALSIGIGMLTKISVGLIAFITGPMMLIIFIRSLVRASSTSPNESVRENYASPLTLALQLIIFTLIVFPLGLSYSIRNLILFDAEIVGIFEVAGNTLMAMKYWKWTFVDRFLSLPINRMVELDNSIFNYLPKTRMSLLNTVPTTASGIYHSFIEYNIWIDLIKTSTYDEFNFSKTLWHPLCILIYVGNYIFHILGLATIVLNIKDLIIDIKNKALSYKDPILNLRILSIMLFILAITAYVGFNIKYQYSCNSNYRYIAYITFAFAISIGIKCLQKHIK